MKRTSLCLALACTLTVLGCRSEGSREQATTDRTSQSAAAATPTKVFSCTKLSVNICTEHRGADVWSDVVKSGCADSGASWLEAACPTENVFGTCTRKYDERTTVTHLYRGKIITDAVAEHLCKDGVWEKAAGGGATVAGAGSEGGSAADAPSAAKVTTHPAGPATQQPTSRPAGPDAKAAATNPKPHPPKPPAGPPRPPLADEAF